MKNSEMEKESVKYAEAYRPGIIEAIRDVDIEVFKSFQIDSRSSMSRIGDILTSLKEEGLLEKVYTSRSKYSISPQHEDEDKMELFRPYVEFAEEMWRETVLDELEEYNEELVREEVTETDLWTKESNSGDKRLAMLKGKEYSDETIQYMRDIDLIEKDGRKLTADESDIEIVREILTE